MGSTNSAEQEEKRIAKKAKNRDKQITSELKASRDKITHQAITCLAVSLCPGSGRTTLLTSLDATYLEASLIFRLFSVACSDPASFCYSLPREVSQKILSILVASTHKTDFQYFIPQEITGIIPLRILAPSLSNPKILAQQSQHVHTLFCFCSSLDLFDPLTLAERRAQVQAFCQNFRHICPITVCLTKRDGLSPSQLQHLNDVFPGCTENPQGIFVGADLTTYWCGYKDDRQNKALMTAVTREIKDKIISSALGI